MFCAQKKVLGMMGDPHPLQHSTNQLQISYTSKNEDISTVFTICAFITMTLELFILRTFSYSPCSLQKPPTSKSSGPGGFTGKLSQT